MKKIYLLVENDGCNPFKPYRVLDAFSNKKAAMDKTGREFPTRWVQIYTLERE